VADDEFLTVDEVAERLRVNPQTVRNWIRAGKCPAVKVGRRVRIRRSALEGMESPARLKSGPRPHGKSEADRFWEGTWLAEAARPPAQARGEPNCPPASGEQF
jgi:excisionase family DNA binding protein